MPIPNAYHEVITTPKASRNVEAYWSFIAKDAGESIVLPDGRCDVILRMDARSQPVPVITGPATTPYTVTYHAGDQWLGLRLRPQKGGLLWGQRITAAKDQAVRGRDAIKLLPALADVAQFSLDQLTMALSRSDILGDAPITRLDRAIDLLHLSGGRLSVKALADRVNCSPRHLHRLFKMHVGLSPKAYAQLIQFHRTLGLVQTGELSITAATFEGGYADHPHLARTFQRFAGFAPSHLPADLSVPTLFA